MKATIKPCLYTRRIKENGKYPVKLRVTFRREKKFYAFGIDLTETEFSTLLTNKKLKRELQDIHFYIEKAENIVTILKENFSWQEFENRFFNKSITINDSQSINFFDWITTYQTQLKNADKLKTHAVYISTSQKLKVYLNDKKKLLFSEINPEFLKKFEEFLIKQGMAFSTIGIYMRNIRTIFNNAVRENVVAQDQYPFGRNKYSPPTGQRVKKALSIEDIGKIYNYIPKTETEHWARDIWLFSYFANGLNVKDIALLKYRNIYEDEINIIRAKTRSSRRENHNAVQIHLADDLKRIINKWGNKKRSPENYVFDILDVSDSPLQIYRNVNQATKTINKYMKRIGQNIGLEKMPTTNFARHSFSTVLKRAGVPIEMISEQLGHSNIKTTEIYLDSFEKDQRKEVAKHLTAFNKNIKE